MNLSNYNPELKRKTFHCMSIAFPVIYLFNTKLTMVIILMLCTGIVLSLDISRHYNKAIQDLVDRLFTNIMRSEEKSGSFKLSGASYMFLGFFISCALFSKGTAISSFLVLIISDSAASIIGKQVGTARENGKSIEGSVAFCFTAVLIGILSYTFHAYHTNFATIIAAAVITTAVEFYSDAMKVNDNLSIPIAYGLVISIFGWFI